jgi:hypothetical protein
MTNYISTDTVDNILEDAAMRQRKDMTRNVSTDIDRWWILTSAYQYGRDSMITERNELFLMKDCIRKIEKADEDFEGDIPPELLLGLYKLARKK